MLLMYLKWRSLNLTWWPVGFRGSNRSPLSSVVYYSSCMRWYETWRWIIWDEAYNEDGNSSLANRECWNLGNFGMDLPIGETQLPKRNPLCSKGESKIDKENLYWLKGLLLLLLSSLTKLFGKTIIRIYSCQKEKMVGWGGWLLKLIFQRTEWVKF